MSFNHKSLLVALFVFAGLQIASAQKELPTESVNIIKDFDARLLESNKVNVPPSLPLLDTSTQRQNYKVPPRPLSVTYEAPKLRPIGMKAGKKEEIYNGYAKLGGGVPTAFLGEVGYYFKAGEKLDGKASFRHYSLNADKALQNQRFFTNNALLNANYYINDKVAVEGKLGYRYDRYHYYGYHDSLSFTEEGTRQDFKMFDIGARIYNKERTDGDLNYSVAPKLYVLNDYFSNRETGFDLNLTAAKWFAEKHPLRLTIRTDLTNFKDSVEQNLNNIYLQPSFTFHSDVVKLKIGGNFASNRDVFSVFPDVELTLRVFGDGVQIFGGVSGDLRKNTFRNLTDYNPYLQIRGTKLRNTRYDNYYGGLKGNLGWLEYSGQVQYAKASGLALIQTKFDDTPTGITRFRVIYDTVKITNLQGSVKLVPFANLVVTGTLSQNILFDPENETKAWGLPRTEGNFNAVYSILDGKANLRGGVYMADGIWFRDEENIVRQGKVLLDLSVGGSYFFTKNIGAFLDLNNVLNNKRERWYRYPMVGLNFLAGITARF